MNLKTVLILAVVAATATCKTTPRTRTRAKAKTKSSTASFFVDDDSTTAATTKMKRRTTESPSIKSDDKRLSLNSLLGNWDYSLTSEDYYYYYYFDDDEESAAKTKSEGKTDAVTKKNNNTSTKASAESLPKPQAQKMTMEKPPTSKYGGNRVGGAGFKIPGGDDDDDRFSLSSLLGDSSEEKAATDKIPFDVAYPKTHVHTPNPFEYQQMQNAMRNAEYERITREKEKTDWMKENIKWERGKSNPLETYVDDQSATLTMLSNAAFVVGSLVSILPLAGVPIFPFVRKRRVDTVRRPPFPYYPPKKYRSVSHSSHGLPYKNAVRVRKVRRPQISARRPSGGRAYYSNDARDHIITHSTPNARLKRQRVRPGREPARHVQGRHRQKIKPRPEVVEPTYYYGDEYEEEGYVYNYENEAEPKPLRNQRPSHNKEFTYRKPAKQNTAPKRVRQTNTISNPPAAISNPDDSYYYSQEYYDAYYAGTSDSKEKTTSNDVGKDDKKVNDIFFPDWLKDFDNLEQKFGGVFDQRKGAVSGTKQNIPKKNRPPAGSTVIRHKTPPVHPDASRRPIVVTRKPSRPQPPLPLPQPPQPKRVPPRVTWSNPPPAPPPSRLPPKFSTRPSRRPSPTRPAPVRTRRPGGGGVPVDTPGGVNEPLDLKPIDPFERAKRGETTQTVETTTKSLFQELVDGTKPIPKRVVGSSHVKKTGNVGKTWLPSQIRPTAQTVIVLPPVPHVKKRVLATIRHRNGKPRRSKPLRKRKFAAQSLQSTFRGHNIDRTRMNHAASEVQSDAMDVAESRSDAPPPQEEEKESRSLDAAPDSSSEQQLLDPVTKELKSQLPLFPTQFPDESGDGGEKVSGYLDLLSNRQKPLPRRVREKLQSRRVRPTADPSKKPLIYLEDLARSHGHGADSDRKSRSSGEEGEKGTPALLNRPDNFNPFTPKTDANGDWSDDILAAQAMANGFDSQKSS